MAIKSETLPKRKINGFTLIELLVVISVIGFLAVSAVVSLNNARAKSRDAKRVADIKQIAKAINMYEQDNGSVPGTQFACLGLNDGQTCWTGVSGSTALNNMLSPYLKNIPKDPLDRAIGGYYVYINRIPTWHCSGTIFPYPRGAYILWVPDQQFSGGAATDEKCLNMGFYVCCDVGNCSSGYYCAYPATL